MLASRADIVAASSMMVCTFAFEVSSMKSGMASLTCSMFCASGASATRRSCEGAGLAVKLAVVAQGTTGEMRAS